MEENSDSHMETDVSSTTDDVLESQQVTSYHGDVETVIVVEELKEDEDGSIDSKFEQPQGDTVSSAISEASPQKDRSPQKLTSPQKVTSPQKKVVTTAVKETNGPRSSLKTLVISDANNETPSVDSSTKIDTTVSPSKTTDTNCIKMPPIQVSHKATFKPIKLVRNNPNMVPKLVDKTIKMVKDSTPPKVIKILEAKEVNIVDKTKIQTPPKKDGNVLESLKKEAVKESPTKEENTKESPKVVKQLKLSPTKPDVLQDNFIKNKAENSEQTAQEVKTLKDTHISPNSSKMINSTTNITIDAQAANVSVPDSDSNTAKNITASNDTIRTTKIITANESGKTAKRGTTDETAKIAKNVSDTTVKTTKVITVSNEIIRTAKNTTANNDTDKTAKNISDESNYEIESTDNETKVIKAFDNGAPIAATEKASANTYPEVLEVPEKDPLDVSQNSDVPEKEHNKSISRELRSLINSAKESKIINECTQLTSKTRKSRIVESPNVSITEGDKLQNRRGSTNSQVSTCSEKSDKPPLKRSMRSQNPEFVTKCKQFLSSVTSKVKESDDAMSEDESDVKEKVTELADIPPKKKKNSTQPVQEKTGKLRSDTYCWRCHYLVEQEQNEKAHPPLHCTVCPRSYHYKCLSGNERRTTETTKSWVCPDCLQILNAESSETRSPAMKKTSLGTLSVLLKHALDRMMELNGAEPFLHPVDRASFPDYDNYIVHPMDLTLMKQNLEDSHYGSTEAFVADVQWILHNSIIFNTLQSKLTAGARALLRSCKAEMGEIEACPECYAAAHAHKPTWFTDVCSTPHILLWAKLKGFPYWPAKGMTVNSSGLVDVRFFGAHDRAWVPAKDCFLFSEKDPNNFRNKRQDILDSMLEAEQHIRNISRKYGKFVYPQFKTQFDPTQLTQQLKSMIPSFEGEVRMKEKPASSPVVNKENKRSLSKSSKSSANEGDASETDDSTAKEAQKSDKENSDKDKIMDIDKPSPQVEIIPTRKRRRSNLEEAVICIMNSSPAEKKRKIDTDLKKSEPQLTSNKDENTPSKKEEAKESKKKTDTPKTKSKDEEPTSSTSEEKESQRVTPIKLVALPRVNKQTPKMFTTKASPKPATPKEDDKTPQKIKVTRSDKTPSSEKVKEAKAQSERRRTSRSKSANSTPKVVKPAEKKAESNEASTSKEKKTKEVKRKDSKENEAEKSDENASKPVDPKPAKDKINFEDDISLAMIARNTRNSGMPTITNVCSLSTAAQATTTDTLSNAKNIEVTIEANSDSSIFTPTSTDNVRNMQDAVTKLQKLRETEPRVGRVGVKAFARMTSPPRTDDNVQVEIKAEPVDLEEADEERHNEKMDLMNACKLRPVNQGQTLRDVRINRVVVPSYVVKKTGKPESRARAKKTFPQPRRVEESRSELNGKNSMVYIPIQPPMTPGPVRGPRPNQQPIRPTAPAPGNKTVNTVTMALKPSTSTVSSPIVAPPAAVTTGAPTVGQVPTTVHTVPLMTSVNGQWMLSLQPVMSVGGVDNTSTAIVNGISDRGPSALIPIAPSPSTPSTPTHSKTTSSSSTPTELPRLQQRPLVHPLDASAAPGAPPPPPAAGPLTAKLHQRAAKMAEFFQTLIEETIDRLDDPAAVATSLRQQMEQQKWRHQQQLDEIKHNHELSIAEMRLSYEKEKVRAVSEARRVGQVELETAVKQAKSKQWCANCYQEAQLYCCWNTAYCDYPCQRAHWPQHYSVCAQTHKDGSEDSGSSSESRLPQPDSLPSLQKSALPATPALKTNDKATSRLAPTQDKTSIIMSMVEDNSGNQTLKCVGTYKANQTQAQIPPLIQVNKQVITDETGKKVVTSGGYLIVGATNNTAAVAAAAAGRSQHVQYYA